MLPRYTKPLMAQLWSEEAKFNRWLSIELAVIAARAKLGLIEEKKAQAIIAHFERVTINVERISEIEAEIEHDMIAFVMAMQETMTGDLASLRGEFHNGITSYDIEDPALIIGLRTAADLILTAMRKLLDALYEKSSTHRWTIMISRTHGQYAEPDTFGRLLWVYHQAISRAIVRVEYGLRTDLGEAKLSGAVGTYGGINWRIEDLVCTHFGLRAAECETQILQRDRHAAFMATLAVSAGSIEQLARTLWEMMRSDTGELEEPRKKKQRGSSAMPQKKNPIKTEQLMGLARRFRGMTVEALENIATPEGRDISQSSVERHILPDATALLHYMAETATRLITGLVVHKDVMEVNLTVRSLGVWAAQRVRVALIEKGVDPNLAYEYTQQATFEAKEAGQQFYLKLFDRKVSDDLPTAVEIIGEEALKACFDPMPYVLPGIKKIFRIF